MQVITSHLNADFDALASMMAAKKLYPEARIVFSGSQERNLREFFLHSTLYLMEFEKLKNIDLAQVDHLILVDVSNASRIGPFNEILDRPGLKLHIYDHHHPKDGALHGEVEVLDDVGAATTLFVELFQQRDIAITPAEATVMALGIYEETGSLTFQSTTPRDLMAAAFLLSKGADLNIVSDFIGRELTADQVAFLNELLHSARTIYRDGIKITIASASSEYYIQDIAVLANKLRDIEGSDAVFVLASLEDRVHIIGRSRVHDVDVSEILAPMGGGGHATAAACVAKGFSLHQAEERLLAEIEALVHPVRRAREIMTSPVITIRSNATLKEAADAMTRYSVNVLPVVDKRGLLGLITREVAQKALFHGLGDSPASRYMTTDVLRATPETPVSEIEANMVEHNQRFFPVVEGGKIAGAITRTDILRSLHDRVSRKPVPEMEAVRPSFRDVRSLLSEKLPKGVYSLLVTAGAVAEEMGINAYLVGGFVRDLLLDFENLDIDIVVEGGGIAFSHRLQEQCGGKVKSHQKFGTAVLLLPDGMKLDIATARTEYYEFPGALPVVEVGSIKKDLYRRDFTINTLSVKINASSFGTLTDFFGARRDIKEKAIRILHNLSFVEDPTRVFRAIRFEQRLGFRISRHTQSLIKNAVKLELFHRLSGERLYAELKLIFSEAEPLKAVQRMNDFGLLKFIHARLTLSLEAVQTMEGTAEAIAWHHLQYFDEPLEPWLLYLMALLDPLTADELIEVQSRLAIPPRVSRLLTAQKASSDSIVRTLCGNTSMKNSRIHHFLKPFPIEVLLNALARCHREEGKKRITHYLTVLRSIKPSVTGLDLRELGLKEGPLYRSILTRVLDACLDGEVKDRDEELKLVNRLIKDGCPAV